MPPPIDDPVFGQLLWDGDDVLVRDDFEYRPGRRVTVMVIFDPEESTAGEVLPRTRLALERFRQNEGQYRLLSGRELNRSRWNDEDVLGDADVANLLSVATLEFDGAGALTVFWDDSDQLFGGHNVVTRIDADGDFVEAGMY